MKKYKRTIVVSTIEELYEFVENMNPYEETIILSGFWNKLEGKKLKIKALVFTRAPVEILKEIDYEN